MAPAHAGNRLTPDAPTPQAPRLSLFDTRHAGTDELLPALHRKKIRKRFKRRLGAPPSGALALSELLVAGVAGTRPIVNLDPPASYRDHARAPPA